MENAGMVICFICAVIILWELSAISFTNKKIKVEGSLPGQKPGIGLFCLFCIIIIAVRWGGGDVWNIAAMAAVALAGFLNLFMKNGLSDYGVYVNGWSTSYDNVKYYDFEREEKGLSRVRLAATRKDMTLLFTPENYQKALAYFEKHKVYDLETYKVLKKQFKEQKRRGGR